MRIGTGALVLALLVGGSFAQAQWRQDEPPPEWIQIEIEGDLELWDVDVEGSIVWVGTQGEGLLAIGYDGLELVRHKEESSGIRKNSWNRVVMVSSDGDKWIGRDDAKTLDRLDDNGTVADMNDDVWTYYSYPDELANRRVFSMAEDSAANMWFGMRDESHSRLGTLELMIETPDTVRWLHFDNTWTPDSTYFSDDDVRALAVDHENRLWIGYNQVGVDVWDYGDPLVFADDTWIHYSSADGLPSDFVQRIHVDPSGRVWVGTSRGVGMFDPSDETWRTIEGLPGTQGRAIASDAQGHVWVGTENGVAVLYRSGDVAFTYDTSDGLADDRIEAMAVDHVRGGVWAISIDDGTAHTHLNLLRSPIAKEGDVFPVYPNPWKEGRSSEFVRVYGVPDGSSIEVYDLLGQRIRDLETSTEPFEWNTLDDDGDEVPSGVYLIRIQTPSGDEVFRKVAVIR